MTTATMIGTIGVAYIGLSEAQATLREYGINKQPDDLDERLVAASRMIDVLPFKDDAPDNPDFDPDRAMRYEAQSPPVDNVPPRIGAAVALIAVALPADGAPVPPPVRQPIAVQASTVGVDYASSQETVQPPKSDDQIMAERLGIPDVRAFRLLRPYLLIPDELDQDANQGRVAVRASRFTFISAGDRALATSLTP